MNTIPLQSATSADKRRALLNKLMAERGLTRAPADESSAMTTIPRRPEGQTRVPQSFAQQRLWFLDRLAPGNPFYTVSIAIPITAAVNGPALTCALDDLVARHETLRTTFTEENAQAVQCVLPPRPAHLDRIDLRHVPSADRDAELERIIREENGRSFDLENGPLMVARLVTLAAEDHQLLLTLHHIVCDGWSLRVLSHELLTLYAAHATGTSARLPELRIQYADFAQWQRAQLTGDAFERQLAYWRKQLADAPELRLPSDRVRPAVPSFRGGLVPLAIAPEQGRAVARLCRESEATPFVVLMSAFMALLSRLAGQEDFVIGTPVASRTHPELEPLIGFFVNTLVLRADLRGGPGFREFVARVRTAALDAFSHQDVPFERLVEELAPERLLGRNPLFQVIFQLFSPQDGALGEAAPVARQRGTAKFDLRLDLWPTLNGGYAGELEYSEDVFDDATGRNIARQFCIMLASLLDGPDAPVCDATAMDDVDRHLVLGTLNSTDRPYPADVGIATLFREVARIHGARVALAFEDGRLTYTELDAASDAMACGLAQRGARSGDAVAVLLDRSTAMLVVWLGILKLGAAYVPLDVSQPALRLAAMISDARCRLVVTTPEYESLVSALDVDIAQHTLHGEAPQVEWPIVRGGDIAHIIFTSGTTGRPKGVRITHRGIARLTCGVEWVDFRPGDRVGQTSNPAFDATTYEVWSALLNGCMLIGIPRETTLSANALARQLVQDRIDHLFLTTILFTRLANERPGMFATLRSLMTGGAKAEVTAFRGVLSEGPPKRLFNAYGPTETTVLGSVWTAHQLPVDAVSVPIGRPVTNTSCYVLDGRLRPVPIGAPGDLYIGGPGVSPGYVGNDASIPERFVPDPWRQGGMLYATGDRVRWRHDLLLEFLGRVDDQVKIRGFRVEPEEIATVLSRHPCVRNAIVLPRERGDGDQTLVAYVEPKSDFGVEPGTADAAEAPRQLVAHWQALYDHVLYDTRSATPTFNTSGWNDTATGAPIPEADMAEQVAQTVERALDTGARRVLDIGCGTGLLLFRLARHCERYVGTDLSVVAIEHVRRVASADPALAHVELVSCAANDLAAIAPGAFDVILLNSVVQYFPSFDYLVEVVRTATARLAPGGFLYLGDIRHYGILPVFHVDVLLQRAADHTSVSALRDELARRLEEEQELAISPAALHELRHQVPGLGPPLATLKRGWRHNELTRFRYDALMRWQAPALALARPVTLHWDDDLASSLDELRRTLETDATSALLVQSIPNARLLRASRATRALRGGDFATAGALRAHLETSGSPEGVEPEALWSLGSQLGYGVQLSWNATNEDVFDALLCSEMPALAVWSLAADRTPQRPLSDLVTRPLRGHFARRLVPDLKGHVAARLPEYMWPDHYVALKQLPLSANGKVDKTNLPVPERFRREFRAAHLGARSDTERRLAALWSTLLDVETPSVHDHFFNDLGGHSLLATQLISRVRREFRVEVPLRVIFEGPTIAELASAIEAARSSSAQGAPLPQLSPDPLTSLNVEQLSEAALDEALAQLSGGQL
jgi:amino acid adenylation domain-containing protein